MPGLPDIADGRENFTIKPITASICTLRAEWSFVLYNFAGLCSEMRRGWRGKGLLLPGCARWAVLEHPVGQLGNQGPAGLTDALKH